MSRTRGDDKGLSKREMDDAMRAFNLNLEKQYAWLENKSVLFQECKTALDEKRITQHEVDFVRVGLFGIATHARREEMHTGVLHNERTSALRTLQQAKDLVLEVLPKLYQDEDRMKQVLDAEILRIKQAAREKEF